MRHNIAARAATTPTALLIGESADLDKIATHLDRDHSVFRFTAAEIGLAKRKMKELSARETSFSVTVDEADISSVDSRNLEKIIKALPERRESPTAFLNILSSVRAATTWGSKDRIITLNTAQDRKPGFEPSSGDNVVDMVRHRTPDVKSTAMPSSLLLSLSATGYEGDVGTGAVTMTYADQQAYIDAYRQKNLTDKFLRSYRPEAENIAEGLAAPIHVLVCDSGDWAQASSQMTKRLVSALICVGIPAQYFSVSACDGLLGALTKVRSEGRQAVVVDAGALWEWSEAFKPDLFLRMIEREEPTALRLLVGHVEVRDGYTKQFAMLSAAAHADIAPSNSEEEKNVWRSVVGEIKRLRGLSHIAP